MKTIPNVTNLNEAESDQFHNSGKPSPLNEKSKPPTLKIIKQGTTLPKFSQDEKFGKDGCGY